VLQGAFGGAAGSSLGSTAEAPLSVAGSGMAFSAREASPMHSSRSPTKARGSNSRVSAPPPPPCWSDTHRGGHTATHSNDLVVLL
jgi:hypothetical protein